MIVGLTGNFRDPWALEVDLEYDLRAIGHVPVRLQEDEVLAEDAPIILAAVQAKVVIATRPHQLAGDHAEMFRGFRRAGIVSVLYSPDLYHGLVRQDSLDQDPWWRADLCFTADGDTPVEAWEQREIRHRWLPPAVGSRWCGLAQPDAERFPPLVAFVGSRSRPEWDARTVLVNRLATTYGADFFWYGPTRVVHGADLNVLCATVPVLVGDAKPGSDRYYSDRVFQLVGRGAYFLHPRTRDLENRLLPGVHADYYDQDDLEALTKEIDLRLQDLASARKIAVAGMGVVAQHHTQRNRLEAILQVAEGSR